MHGGSTGWHRKSGFLFAKSAANRQKPVREALKPTADKPTMRASQRIILTITATSMLHAVNAADIEKQLPERWERNDREQGFMEDFQQDISRIPSKPRRFATTPAPERIPADFAPWWIRGQGSTIGSKTRGQGVSLENLYVRAIQNSNQIRVFSDLPLIRETGIQEAKGAFDTNSFVSAMFDRKNEPVGNTLTTGGANRFKQDEWSLEAGVRKKFVTGTEVTVSQSSPSSKAQASATTARFYKSRKSTPKSRWPSSSARARATFKKLPAHIGAYTLHASPIFKS
jgi:hypothetical protein